MTNNVRLTFSGGDTLVLSKKFRIGNMKYPI